MKDPITALQNVIRDWDIVNLILVVVFFPWSLIYIAFRVVQEME